MNRIRSFILRLKERFSKPSPEDFSVTPEEKKNPEFWKSIVGVLSRGKDTITLTTWIKPKSKEQN